MILEVTGDPADPDVAMRHTLAALARRWMDLHEEIKIHAGHFKRLTRAAALQLRDAFGIGLDVAAQMLIAAARRRRPSACSRPSCTGTPPPVAQNGRPVARPTP